MGGEKENLDLSDLNTSLPAAAAALSAEDRVGLVNALKDKLQSLAGQHADVLESLSPNVRRRVEFLRGIQSQHDEIETKFFEERAALEAKYQKLYEPLYAKRYDIVNGVVEVDGVAKEPTTENAAEGGDSDAKGVPDFWLTALKTNDVLTEEIQERDEPVLKYLKDIKWSRIDDPKGFKLLTARAAAESGSKRTCAAELHNLSDKRRRSRINEKMKALQSLIPNSNKVGTTKPTRHPCLTRPLSI